LRVLGVDPGSLKTGWGIVDIDPSHPRGAIDHVDNGVLFLDSDRDLTIRLVDLCHRLKDVVTRYQPHTAAVEDVFVHRGARSALVLGQARGATLATLGLCGLKVVSVPTSAVKLRVTGRGRADKGQVAEMVRVQLRLAEVPFEDAADALAVALAVCGELQAPISAATRPSAAPKKRGRAAWADVARAQGKWLGD
jgi:crossover junction endodeoxyribonuclease RuvC